MLLPPTQALIWNRLSTQERQSYERPIAYTPGDTSLEEPGVYAIWEGNDLLYLGTS
jgi:hypothetical protein